MDETDAQKVLAPLGPVERMVGRPGEQRAALSPLKRRIVDALAKQPRQRMSYYDLGAAMWPPHLCPRAWNYSSNGGPYGWAMPLGKALRELREAGIAHEQRPSHGGCGHGDVVLLKTPNVANEAGQTAAPLLATPTKHPAV